jgi:hypothetical protein
MMDLDGVTTLFLSSSFIFVFMFISMYDTFTSPTFESNEEDDNDEEEDEEDASAVIAVATSVFSIRRLDITILAFVRQIFRSSTFEIIIDIINIISSSTGTSQW